MAAYSGRGLAGARYVLGNQLGRGGMASVFRAHDRLTGREVALKRLPLRQTGILMPTRLSEEQNEFRLALTREFQILASLRHPNIISVLDYGLDAQGQPFFTMELMESAQALDIYARTLTLDGKIEALVQILRALMYLHRRSVLHRDLKPSNILAADGVVRVLDFGLSVPFGQNAETAGTLAYIAPEVLNQRPYTPAADLYAVGVIAYQMFAGRHPFEINSPSRFLDQIVGAVPDLSPLNVSPGVAAVIARLLHKDPAGRFPDARQTLIALEAGAGLPPSAETAATRESFLQAAAFVGRETELKTLQDALAAAVGGQGSAWLIGGESGIGKSRLLDELRIRAMVAGCLTLAGNAVDGGGLPYQVWRSVVRRLAIAGPLSDFEAGVLKPLIPDIEVLFERPIPDAPSLEGQPGQARLIDLLIGLLKRAGQPVVLIAEDLQWVVNTPDFALLQAVVAAANELPLLVVGSYRDDEAPQIPGLLRDARPIRLVRLPSALIQDLSVSMLGAAGQRAQVVEFLEHETEGNLFFLVEVVRALAEETGSLERIGQVTLPVGVLTAGIRAVVARRLGKVPESDQPLLRLAAVAGRLLDPKVLAQFRPEGLSDWLQMLADLAIVQVQDDTWVFSHDKLREALLQGLPSDERAALHRQVAEGVERAYPNDASRAVILAEHWLAAGDYTPTVHYVNLAARQALVAGAAQNAQTLLSTALNLLGRESPAALPLLILGARTAYRLSEYEKALDLVAQARRLAGAFTRESGELDFVEGTVYSLQGELEMALACFERSLAVCRVLNDMNGIAEALNGTAGIHRERGNYAHAITEYQGALAIRRDLGQHRETALLLHNLGLIYYQIGNFDLAQARFDAALPILESLGDKSGQANTLMGMGLLAYGRHLNGTARAAYARAAALYKAIGDRRGLGMAYNNLGLVAHDEGDLTAAESYYNDYLAVTRAIGARRGTAVALLNLGIIAVDRGDTAAARQQLLASLGEAHAIGHTLVMLDGLAGLARLRALESNPEGALELLATTLSHPAADVETRREAEPLRSRLESSLSPARYAELWARGVAQDFEATVRQALDTAS